MSGHRPFMWDSTGIDTVSTLTRNVLVLLLCDSQNFYDTNHEYHLGMKGAIGGKPSLTFSGFPHTYSPSQGSEFSIRVLANYHPMIRWRSRTNVIASRALVKMSASWFFVSIERTNQDFPVCSRNQ